MTTAYYGYSLEMALDKAEEDLLQLERDARMYSYFLGLEYEEMGYWTFPGISIKLPTLPKLPALPPLPAQIAAAKKVFTVVKDTAKATIQTVAKATTEVRKTGGDVVNKFFEETKKLPAKGREFVQKGLIEPAKKVVDTIANSIAAFKTFATRRIKENLNKVLEAGRRLMAGGKGKLESATKHLSKARAAYNRLIKLKKVKKFQVEEEIICVDYDSCMKVVESESKAAKTDAIASEADQMGAKEAVADIETKAQVGVSATPDIVTAVSGWIAAEIVNIVKVFLLPVRALIDGVKYLLERAGVIKKESDSLLDQLKKLTPEQQKEIAKVLGVPPAERPKEIAKLPLEDQKAVRDIVDTSNQAGHGINETKDALDTVKIPEIPREAVTIPAWTPEQEAAAPDLVAYQKAEEAALPEATADETTMWGEIGKVRAVEKNLEEAKDMDDIKDAATLAVKPPVKPPEIPVLPIIGGIAVLATVGYLATRKRR